MTIGETIALTIVGALVYISLPDWVVALLGVGLLFLLIAYGVSQFLFGI